MQIANIFLLMELVSIARPRGTETGVSKDLRGIQRNGGEGGGVVVANRVSREYYIISLVMHAF